MTPHFSFDEAIKTSTGLANTPSPRIAASIGVTAIRMEGVRDCLGVPINVNSWYRCDAVNKAVGGSENSAHPDGVAVDFKVDYPGGHIAAAKRIVAKGIMFDQLILEYGWIHISFDPRMRQQTLTKKSSSTPYLSGLVA